ncbi:uncharacterized protein LOC124705663 [Lolium rigidum]|uniref:uncharacterized protein LOC124705663 n=1 Tax=Lolium rigidum TaxID=89674 RepID=UPI001F5D23FA|nr:uncharacterized protein LOC124705663 [Lolium rigidum]
MLKQIQVRVAIVRKQRDQPALVNQLFTCMHKAKLYEHFSSAKVNIPAGWITGLLLLYSPHACRWRRHMRVLCLRRLVLLSWVLRWQCQGISPHPDNSLEA